MNELPIRKPHRLKDYDYRQNGAYFVTLCIKNRREILGNIVGATVPGRPCMELSEIGKVVDSAIKHYQENLDGVVFERYVIMPNHVHAIIVIRSETGDRGRSPLQNIVRHLKSYVTKKIGFSPWQKSFHDHVIRNEEDYMSVAEYIENNPLNWKQDCFFVNENA